MSGSAPQLVDHLFRREAGRMVAALVRALGTQNLALAEDAVQDVLCTALEAWKYGRVPDNPPAWLMRAAKNRAIDLVRRGALQGRVAPALQSEWTLLPAIDALFDDHAIEDDDLRLIFSCCVPPQLPSSASSAFTRFYARQILYDKSEVKFGPDPDDTVVIWQSVRGSIPTPHPRADWKIVITKPLWKAGLEV